MATHLPVTQQFTENWLECEQQKLEKMQKLSKCFGIWGFFVFSHKEPLHILHKQLMFPHGAREKGSFWCCLRKLLCKMTTIPTTGCSLSPFLPLSHSTALHSLLDLILRT